jgi:hypothetical protein
MHVLDALREAGVNADVWNLPVPSGIPRSQVAQYALDAMTARLAGKQRLPELFFFCDDYIASGAITAMLYVGVRIPKDVRVAALSNCTSGSGLVFPIVAHGADWDAVVAFYPFNDQSAGEDASGATVENIIDSSVGPGTVSNGTGTGGQTPAGVSVIT